MIKSKVKGSRKKRNNNIDELSAEGYNHIFGVLFKEKVTIKDDGEKDIPRV